MAYKKKYKKPAPTKFITAVFGGAALRQEQYAAQEDFLNQMEAWENRKMKNPYAGVKNPYENLENVYEDQTVNLKQAEFEKEQSQQAMANIMTNMQGAAGGSGVAGLAQVLANQGVKQAQQASLSIGAQEQANQQRMVAESGRLQQLKVGLPTTSELELDNRGLLVGKDRPKNLAGGLAGLADIFTGQLFDFDKRGGSPLYGVTGNNVSLQGYGQKFDGNYELPTSLKETLALHFG